MNTYSGPTRSHRSPPINGAGMAMSPLTRLITPIQRPILSLGIISAVIAEAIATLMVLNPKKNPAARTMPGPGARMSSRLAA